jgi:CHAT domain-containing protein
MNLDMHARLATLSDGGSASRRDAAPAAEVVRWAWRAAGVPSVLLSRWATEPPEAARVLKELYTGLNNGDTPDTALANAGRTLRRRADSRAPYYWAGWMVIGR